LKHLTERIKTSMLEFHFIKEATTHLHFDYI